MSITNKIITNKDLIAFNNYLDSNNLRKRYGDRPDSLWYKEDCYVKWASCLMMFDDVKRPAIKVVDLGVGDGPIAHAISHQGYDVVGVDLTRVNHPYQSLVVMVLKDAIEFIKGYEDETVDVFLDSCSVTHFNFTSTTNDGWASVFKSVKRILKPGGYFLVSSDIKFEKDAVGEFISPEVIVKTAEECGLTLTSEVDYNRDDAISRTETGYGVLGVANFCFKKT